MTDDLLAPADLLAAYLNERPSLAWVVGMSEDDDPIHERLPVLVDRQLDLESTVVEAASKALGACLIIGLAGWNLVDPAESRSRLTLDLTYNLSLWAQPVTADPAMPGQSVMIGRVMLEVARFEPRASEHDALPMPLHLSRWKQGRGDIVPAKYHLTYAWNATTRVEIDLRKVSSNDQTNP